MRYLSVIIMGVNKDEHITNNIIDGLNLLGNYSGLMLFICLILMSMSIISMIVFGCADGAKKRRRGGSAGYGDGGVVSASGWGYYGGHGGGNGHGHGFGGDGCGHGQAGGGGGGGIYGGGDGGGG
ncbi:hypothetical protein RND81_14G140000 [Saponaria officinalis]|uniref:Glycine-rich protein n=1 Tax=Saponaria officinalis TaxID=3572 RepID=A0AAW1GW56_SAPOF